MNAAVAIAKNAIDHLLVELRFMSFSPYSLRDFSAFGYPTIQQYLAQFYFHYSTEARNIGKVEPISIAQSTINNKPPQISLRGKFM